jgi:hypothetical protein
VNRRTAITVGLLFIVALFATAVVRQRPGQLQAQPADPKPPILPAKKLIGTTSCSASVCHGGSDLGKPFSEATTWRSLDPHARAYDTLLNEQSQTIAKHLWGDKMPAHEASLCLKCHVHPEYDRARPNFRKQDGVGCESCHGAAENWLTPHYRTTWKDTDKQALGLADTKSLQGRANVCVKCHVGSPDANVDHDLIAAGHPALRFEFATYFANLPPHWDVAKDKRRNSTTKLVDFEAHAWVLGQVVSARAALELLAARADQANGRPWPELAEFDCFACHHDLQNGKWRQNRQHPGARRPGSLVWNPWYFAVVSGNGLQYERPVELRFQPIFSDFRPGTRGRTEIAKQARNAVDALDMVIIRGRLGSSFDIGSLHFGIGRSDGFESWDQATQHYLSLVALRQYRKDNNQPVEDDLERQIAKLRAEVTFAPRFNGPRRLEKKN